jgi:hypothetical protein
VLDTERESARRDDNVIFTESEMITHMMFSLKPKRFPSTGVAPRAEDQLAFIL